MKHCADSEVVSRSHPASNGGSIPASALFFRVNEVEEAKRIVALHHYSRRWAGSTLTGTFHLSGGLFGNCGETVAACVFATPPTRWSEPVVELVRLVRKPGPRVPLSKLVSMTIARVRAMGYDLAVSFADAAQDHHGGVYQSCGWHYAGKRERAMDGLIVDGVFVPGRSCNSAWGTRSPEKLRTILPKSTIVAHYDDGKHLYWKAINKSGKTKATRLGLPSQPYPKPQQTTGDRGANHMRG
jgi:hypothetical protein